MTTHPKNSYVIAAAALAAAVLTGCAGESEPAETITVTAEPTETESATDTETSDALDEAVRADPATQRALLDGMMEGLTEDERDDVCASWLLDTDGMIDRMLEDDLPVDPEVVEEWVTDTCLG